MIKNIFPGVKGDAQKMDIGDSINIPDQVEKVGAVSRREFLQVLGSLTAMTMIPGCVRMAAEKVELHESIIYHRQIAIYQALILGGRANRCVFVDRNSLVVADGYLPNDWKSWDVDQQDTWRKTVRKGLKKQFGTLESSLEQNYNMITALGLYPEGHDRDLVHFLQDNARQKVLGVPKAVDRHTYIANEFEDTFSPDYRYHTLLNAYLRDILPGLVALESRYDNGLGPSSAGAIGIFQLMPSMIGTPIVNPHRYPVDEVRVSLVKQCELAKNLFRENTYNFLGENTDKDFLVRISDGYFSGNRERAIGEFFLPLIVTAYNTGTPLLITILRDFLSEYPHQKNLEEGRMVEYKSDDMGKDVFYAFIRFARYQSGNELFGDDAYKYALKAHAFARVLGENSSHNHKDGYTQIPGDIAIHRKGYIDLNKIPV